MTNTIKTTAAAATAAAIIGGAVLLVPENQNAENFDVALPVVNVPQVNVPQVNVPQVSVPQVDLAVELPQVNTAVELPQMSDLLATAQRSADWSDVEIAVVATPQVNTAVELPQMSDLLATAQRSADGSDVKIAAVELPQVADPANRIPLVQKFFAECRQFFRDQRMVQHDSSLGIDNTAANKWLEIYRKNQKYDLEFVRLPAGIRMIAEIHHPINQSVLRKNLAFYKQQNFNAVLLTFGYSGEKISDLLCTVGTVKRYGMKLFIAYAGPEDLKHSVLQDPDGLAEKLKVLSVNADGFLLGWRRTSLHLFEQDAAYINYILKQVRSWNKNIAILGEAYYGQTASSNHKLRNLQYNVPANTSGVLMTGLGYNGVAVDLVLNKLLVKIKRQPKLALITGDRPYYATRAKNGKTFAQNLAIKKAIADRWIAAGASGVIVLHGDGSDGIYEKEHTDNIAVKEVSP